MKICVLGRSTAIHIERKRSFMYAKYWPLIDYCVSPLAVISILFLGKNFKSYQVLSANQIGQNTKQKNAKTLVFSYFHASVVKFFSFLFTTIRTERTHHNTGLTRRKNERDPYSLADRDDGNHPGFIFARRNSNTRFFFCLFCCGHLGHTQCVFSTHHHHPNPAHQHPEFGTFHILDQCVYVKNGFRRYPGFSCAWLLVGRFRFPVDQRGQLVFEFFC